MVTEGGRFRTTTSTTLLEGLRRSDNHAVWLGFVGRYRPLIVRFARRAGLEAEDAEDAAQQSLLAFTNAYRRGSYDRDRGRLRVWLYGIASNTVRDAIRRHYRRAETRMPGQPDQTDFFAALPDDDRLPELWEQEWQKAVLQQCLAEIKQVFDVRTVAAFELFAREGWPARRVAEHLGMSCNAVFLAKHKILKRIRELLPRMDAIW